MGFDFSPPSFGIGFAAGVGASWLGYRTWRAIKRSRSAVILPQGNRETVTARRGDRRYLADLIRTAQGRHLAGSRISLTDVLVEPRFLPPDTLAAIPDDNVARDIWDVVPRIYDYPALHAPYNLPSLRVEDLGRGEQLLLIAGPNGSGRTTALMTIALWSAGILDFEQKSDQIEEQITQAEAELTPEERAERVKRRLEVMQRAEERLAENRTDDNAEQRGPIGFRRKVPIYLHLSNLTIQNFNRRIDPAEPIVRAVQSEVRWLTARRVPKTIYDLVNKGQALLLLDGYDTLSNENQQELIAWLDALLQTHPQNAIILTTNTYGYGPLTQLGFVPVHLKPWSDEDIIQVAEKWAENWRSIGYSRQGTAREAVENVQLNSRTLLPAEICLRMWSIYDDQTGEHGDWVKHYLLSFLPGGDHLLPDLARMAALQLEDDFISIETLVELGIPTRLEDNPPELMSEDGQTAEEPEPGPEIQSTEEHEKSLSKRKAEREARKFIQQLVNAGVLIERRSRLYQFASSHVTGYLASRVLADAELDDIVIRARDPRWNLTLAYTATIRDMEQVALSLINDRTDLRHDTILKLTLWLAIAGNTTWRERFLNYLEAQFAANNAFTHLRERIAAALVQIGDTDVQAIFQRALRHLNPEVRRIASLSLGVLRDDDSIRYLSGMTEEPDPDVPLAAAMALGAIATEEALLEIVHVLESSDNEDLRRVVAETLTLYPEVGYPTLHEAVQSDDILLRRAAVWGIGRIEKNWALITLEELMLEDHEWYVRSAAQSALQEQFRISRRGVSSYPQLGAVPWLVSWANEQIDRGDISGDAGSIELLKHAINQRDDPLIRSLSAITAAQLYVTEALPDLYRTLADREAPIRDRAHRALSYLQAKMGVPLPAAV